MADTKLNFIQDIKIVFHRTESIMVKGENDGFQYNLLFLNLFPNDKF